jgi:hypothetical protein
MGLIEFARRPDMTKIDRAFTERRSGKDRRRIIHIKRFFFKGNERRRAADRRSKKERRSGWIRISKWSSVPLSKLKIAKFLKNKN